MNFFQKLALGLFGGRDYGTVEEYEFHNVVEVKNCPCCGGEAFWMIPSSEAIATMYGISDGGEYHAVECEECGLQTSIWDTKERAIAAWNKRVK